MPSTPVFTTNDGSTTQLTLLVPASAKWGDTAAVRVRSLLPPDPVDRLTYSADWSLQVVAGQ
jgi:hypothetical protein